MVERTDGMSLCEICEKRGPTHTLPRGPHHEGIINVCDECARNLYAFDVTLRGGGP
jgi:hypothetical protein